MTGETLFHVAGFTRRDEMSEHSNLGRNHNSLSASEDESDIEREIDATCIQLANTRAFLADLLESEVEPRKYLKEILEQLNYKLYRLKATSSGRKG